MKSSSIDQMWQACDRAFAALDSRAEIFPLKPVEVADRRSFFWLLWMLKHVGDDQVLKDRLKKLQDEDPLPALPRMAGDPPPPPADDGDAT